MIFTSCFQNPELATNNYTVPGIVRGTPRFRLKYELAGNLIDIAPPRELFDVDDRDEFTPLYMAHLDRIGVERIEAKLQKYLDTGKDVMLCCYEDVREQMNGGTGWYSPRGGCRERDGLFLNYKDNSPVKVKERLYVIKIKFHYWGKLIKVFQIRKQSL